MSNDLLGLLSDKQFDKLVFTANEPVTMVIDNVIEVPEKERLDFKMAVLDGEHADKKHTIFANYYMKKKDGTVLLNPTLSTFVRALLQDQVKAIEYPKDASLEDKFKLILNTVFNSIDETLIARKISVTFKPVNGEWQNIKSIVAVKDEAAPVVSEKEVTFD